MKGIISTVIVGAVVLAVIVAAVYFALKSRKKGGCGCGCDCCGMKDSCHKNENK